MRYIVFHAIRAGQKTHRTAKLAVTDVPEKTSANAVMSVLETSGKAHQFSEAGVLWGNHEVKSATSVPAGAEGVDEAPSVSWNELQNTREVRRVTLRLQPQDYGQIAHAAQRKGQSMQEWCVNTLVSAATDKEQ
jgi:hypothetical protein